MTRKEHLAWCKRRALEYLEDNDLTLATSSMLYDLGKHPETAGSVEIGALTAPVYTAVLTSRFLGEATKDEVRRWIEGFN